MSWNSAVPHEPGYRPESPQIAQPVAAGPCHRCAVHSRSHHRMNANEVFFQFMVNGWDAKRIAAALDISVLTVRKHIANITINSMSTPAPRSSPGA